MMSSVIPASVKKPFAMPIYQGQPTALAAPIIPVEMISAALTDGAAKKASTQHSAPMNCVSRDETMALLPNCPRFLCRGMAYFAGFSGLRQCGGSAQIVHA